MRKEMPDVIIIHPASPLNYLLFLGLLLSMNSNAFANATSSIKVAITPYVVSSAASIITFNVQIKNFFI